MFATCVIPQLQYRNMILEQTIVLAAEMLKQASPPGSRVLLFGSYAKGTAGNHSDVDFMVVEPQVAGWLRETDRLYRAVRPLRLPMDFDRHDGIAVSEQERIRRHGVSRGIQIREGV